MSDLKGKATLIHCGLTVEVSPDMWAACKLFFHDILIDLLVLQDGHIQHLLLGRRLAACCVDAAAHSAGVGWSVQNMAGSCSRAQIVCMGTDLVFPPKMRCSVSQGPIINNYCNNNTMCVSINKHLRVNGFVAK